MKNKSLHPEWALACKRKGTELRLLKGKYYLYEVTSKWNPLLHIHRFYFKKLLMHFTLVKSLFNTYSLLYGQSVKI